MRMFVGIYLINSLVFLLFGLHKGFFHRNVFITSLQLLGIYLLLFHLRNNYQNLSHIHFMETTALTDFLDSKNVKYKVDANPSAQKVSRLRKAMQRKKDLIELSIQAYSRVKA